MAITIPVVCTHPARCAEMEQAHGDMAAQLAAAQGKVQQLQAQLMQLQSALMQRDETLAAVMADNDRLRGDVQMYVSMFDEATRKAVRA